MKEELQYNELVNYIFKEYLSKKNKENLYFRDIILFKNIINLYFAIDRKDYFRKIIDKYKDLYIYDESRIEQNITKEEQLGLGEIYDYISNFNFDKDMFNIFIISLIMHEKLYSKTPNKEFGGKLRNVDVSLYDLDIDIPNYNIAIKEFNSYLNQDKSNQIFNNYNDNELFLYINDCIVLTTKLIKLQPFQDGNKRTFRALLNLLLKRVNIPPIFIELNEREEYKKALVKALTNDDYQDIIKFYYYKICDSIILLDIDNYKTKTISGVPSRNRTYI